MGQSHVVIVGGGAAGTLQAIQLADRMRDRCRLTMLDRDGRFGRGVAYSTTAAWHRINIPAIKMGGRSDADPTGFVDWLARHAPPVAADYSASFVPRSLYGDYLNEIIAELTAAGTLVTERSAVVAIAPDRSGCGVITETGHVVRADAAVLCLGNPPAAPMRSVPVSERWIGDVWKPGELSRIAADERVLIIGSGATAVDVVLDLHHRRHAGHMLMVSRRGLLPCVDVPPAAYTGFKAMNLDAPSMRDLVRQLRSEIEVATASGVAWQTVLDAFREHIAPVWRRSSDTERGRFLRHLRSVWLVHRHRLAPDVAALLSRLQSDGTLSVVAGRLQNVEIATNGYVGVINGRGGQPQTFHVDWIINCTGPEERYDRLDDPLVRHLLAQGAARPGPMGLGLDVDDDGQVFDRAGQPRRGLYALGPPTRGRFWEITAVPWIRANAAKIAAHIEAAPGTRANVARGNLAS